MLHNYIEVINFLKMYYNAILTVPLSVEKYFINNNSICWLCIFRSLKNCLDHTTINFLFECIPKFFYEESTVSLVDLNIFSSKV